MGTIALVTSGSGGDVTVVNDAGLTFAASTVGGALSATATTGNIADSGALAITGTTTLVTSANDGTIILDSTNSFTGRVDLSTKGTSGHVTLTIGTTDLSFTTSEVRGNLTVTTGSGSEVDQNGVLTVDGATDIKANDGGNNILLQGQENVLTGAVSLDGWNVRLTNAKALELGKIDSRALILTARGAITQTETQCHNIGGEFDYNRAE